MGDSYQHPAFPQPEDLNAAIWRYMPFYKFEWLVNEKRLYMTHVVDLEDSLEGTAPEGYIKWWNSRVNQATSVEEGNTITTARNKILQFAAAFRKLYYVSCWHMNEYLNPKMWDLYTDGSNSVAIKSTYVKLREELPDYVYLGMVRYINYNHEQSLPTQNMFEYIMHKDKNFEFEYEVRAVATEPLVEGPEQNHFYSHHLESNSNSDVLIFAPKIDVSNIIQSVIVHPQASKSFINKTRSFCEKKCLPFEIA